MIPLKDENPTRRTAVVTIVLIVMNVGIYFGVQPDVDTADSAEFTFEWAAIPCELTTGEPLSYEELPTTISATSCNEVPESEEVFPDKNVWFAALVSMFLHGSIMHLGFNMLFLWVFGNNIEDELGVGRYVLFYLIGGLAATIVHVLVQPSSTVPVVGASGAIAAVMGAYLVWHPNARIKTVIFFVFILFRDVTAKWLLIIWFFLQFLDAFNPNSGVAWGAHVGGFVFGVVVGAALRTTGVVRPRALRAGY